eukprot:c21778_g4_i1 orf=206-559(+)
MVFPHFKPQNYCCFHLHIHFHFSACFYLPVSYYYGRMKNVHRDKLAASFSSDTTTRSKAHLPRFIFPHLWQAPNIVCHSSKFAQGISLIMAAALSRWPARPKRLIMQVRCSTAGMMP